MNLLIVKIKQYFLVKIMDLFKSKNIIESTSIDFYDTHISKGNTRLRNKDKRRLHKLSRTRIKRDTLKESLENNL